MFSTSFVGKQLDHVTTACNNSQLPKLKITRDTPDPTSILAIDYTDLHTLAEIPWHPVNVVFLETFQQAISAMPKFDKSKSYIFVAESAVERAILRDALADLTIVDVFTIFDEVFDFGRQLFNYSAKMPWLDRDHTNTPEFDFFCLLGRCTDTRKHLVDQLLNFDVSKSLIKYHGKRYGHYGAPDLDTINYNPLTCYTLSPRYYGQNPGKMFQTDLYKNFKFEVQHETDPYSCTGWQLPEYHVTEKTLKPLVLGFPCLMFGPQKYHSWLKTFGVDLGLGKFNLEFDEVRDNHDRLDRMIEQIPSILNSSYAHPTQDAIDKNIAGLVKLSAHSMKNLKSLCKLLTSI